jgi:hypothetical protein
MDAVLSWCSRLSIPSASLLLTEKGSLVTDSSSKSKRPHQTSHQHCLPYGSVFSVVPSPLVCLFLFFSLFLRIFLDFVRLLILFVIGWKDPCDLICSKSKKNHLACIIMYFRAVSLISSPARPKLLTQLSLHGSRTYLSRVSNRSARVRRRSGTKDLGIWEWNGTWLLQNPLFVVPTRRLYPLWFHRFHVSSMDQHRVKAYESAYNLPCYMALGAHSSHFPPLLLH